MSVRVLVTKLRQLDSDTQDGYRPVSDDSPTPSSVSDELTRPIFTPVVGHLRRFVDVRAGRVRHRAAASVTDGIAVGLRLIVVDDGTHGSATDPEFSILRQRATRATRTLCTTEITSVTPSTPPAPPRTTVRTLHNEYRVVLLSSAVADTGPDDPADAGLIND